MSSFKKFLSGKKKSSEKLKKNSLQKSTGSLNKSTNSLNLSASLESLGSYYVKEKDLSKLLKAVWNADLAKIKQISNKKTNWNETDKYNRSALHLAAAGEHEDVVKYLLSNNAKVNVTDSEGKTPLIKACEVNSAAIVECLLNNGAECNVYDVHHVSPMHIAAAHGNADIGLLLIDRDAKLDGKDQQQITPLHLACGLGHKEFAELLLSENTPMDSMDAQKRTPLMMACIDGHTEIVKLLLQYDADTGVFDKDGNTAEELARINNHDVIFSLIREKESKSNIISPTTSNKSTIRSPRELFSPVAQSLNEMFLSSPAAAGITIFGGPALNTGGAGANEKSEESQSEGFGDDKSWGDSDTESDISAKKTRGFNISAMLKKNEEETKIANVKDRKTTTNEMFLNRPTDVVKPAVTVTAPSVSDQDSSATHKDLSATKNIKTLQNQQQKESEFSDDDSGSDWGDEGLEELLAGKKAGEPEVTPNSGKRKHGDGKNIALFVVPPPPPPEVDLSGGSSDFDSSQPDGTFSDLPLSDMDHGKKKTRLLATKSAKKLFAGSKDECDDDDDESKWESDDGNLPESESKSKKKFAKENEQKSNGEESSKWDSEDDDLSNPSQKNSKKTSEAVINQRKSIGDDFSQLDHDSDLSSSLLQKHGGENVHAGIKQHETIRDDSSKWDSDGEEEATQSNNEDIEVTSPFDHTKQKQTKTIPTAKQPTMELPPDNDEWDSDSPLPSEPSEEVLPPRTPEQYSDFQPSSEDDDNDGEDEPTKPDVQTSLKSIFQTEVLSPQNQDLFEGDDELDQMLSSTQPNSKPPFQSHHQQQQKQHQLAKSVNPSDARKKQLQDLGLDLGSSISDVSEPEGIEASKQSQHENEEEDKNNDHIVFSDDDDTATETESEWEVEQRQNRQSKLTAEKKESRIKLADVESQESVKILQKRLEEQNKKEKEKEAERLKEFEKTKMADADCLAAEIAAELRQEIIDDENIDFESNSDFSFSEDDNGNINFEDNNQIATKIKTGAERLQQMEEKNEVLMQQDVENSMVKTNFDVVSRKVPLIDRNNVDNQEMGQRDRVSSKQNETELKTNVENVTATLENELTDRDKARDKEEMLKNVLLKEKQAREEQRRLEKEDHKKRLQLKNEEELRQRLLADEERERKRVLAEKEEQAKLALQKEEMNMRRRLDEELQEKLKALAEKEEEQKKHLQAEIEMRMRALDDEELLRKRKLEEEELERKQALSDEERERRKNIDQVETRLRAELEKKEGELKRMHEEELKRQQLLSEQEIELKKMEELKAQRKRVLEEELLREEFETKQKLQEKQKRLYEEMEKQTKEKEINLQKQLQELVEKQKLLKQQEDAKALTMKESLENTKELESLLKLSLEEEMSTMREKLNKELLEEEEARRRKISVEEEEFLRQLEIERKQKLQEVADKTEENRQNAMKELEEEQLTKRREFAEDAAKREEQLCRKLTDIENSRLKELENIVNERMKRLAEVEKRHLQDINDMTKEKEMEVTEKLLQIQQKEEKLKEKESQMIVHNSSIDELQSQEEYRDRFHELEKKSRLREQELELRIAELRNKHKLISKNIDNARALAPVPVEELTFTAMEVTAEQQVQEKDFFAEMSSNEDNEADEDTQMQKDDPGTIDSVEDQLKRSQAQREIVSRKLQDMSQDRRGGNPSGNNSRTGLMNDSSPLKYLSNHPRPILSSSAVNDESLVEELEAELQQTQRQVELWRENTLTHERIKREMEDDMEELHRTIEMLSQSQNEKDKSRLDADLERRSLKYQLEQELESKAMVERLCNQLKDQLARSENKLTKETESRQATELANRKATTELKTREQLIGKLQSDIHEAQLALESEKQSRTIQEKLYEEQLRQHEIILNEAQKTSHDHAQAVSKLEVLDETRRQAEKTTDMLKMELDGAKGEMTRVQSLLDKLRSQSTEELNRLRDKLQEKSDALTNVEKQLFQIQLQLDNERSTKKATDDKYAVMSERENEKKKRLQEEVASLKTLLEKSNREIDKLGDLKGISDKELANLKEKHFLEKVSLDKELTIANEQLKSSNEKLASRDKDVLSLNQKLELTTLTLREKTEEASVSLKDVTNMATIIQDLEEKLRDEKLLSNRLEVKLESTTEKSEILKDECDKLKAELQKLKEQYADNERTSNQKQEAVNSYMLSAKDDYHKERVDLLLKNEQNILLMEKLKAELTTNRQQLSEKENKLRQLQEELVETKKELETSEEASANHGKEKNEILSENYNLKQDIESLLSQVKSMEETDFEIKQQYHDVQSELEQSKLLADETTQRLALKSGDIDHMRRANSELTEALENMKKQNIMMEADLREAKAKGEILLEDLHFANEARENLETLLSNVKGTNVALEEKLHSEALHRTHQERQAEEHKGLWESEVKSRSKLGLKLMEMEKAIGNLKSEIQEEKRKAQHAMDLKLGSDKKLEIYEQRSEQHHTEIAGLKTKLKQYQKRLKDFENGESRLPLLHAQFNQEREEMANSVNKLRRQLDQQSNRLSEEQEMRNRAEHTCREQTIEINDLKTAEKVRAYEIDKLSKKCDDLEEKLKRQKDFFMSSYIPQEQIEEFKQALETKSRLDLNKKLQEVNMHLEEQALAREAFEKIRNQKEAKTKRDFEETILDLKRELSAMRSSLHEGLSKRDTSETQVGRFKKLLDTERSENQRLSDSLAKTKERLSLEKIRTNYLYDETVNKSNISKKLFDDSGDKDAFIYSPNKTAVVDDTLLGYKPKHWSTPLNALSSPSHRNHLSMRRNVLS